MGLGNQSQHKLISCHDTNHWKIELIEIEFYRIMSMRIDDYVCLTNEVLSFAKHIHRCPLIVPFGTISLLVPWIWVCYLTWSIQGQHYSDIRRDVVSNHQRLDCLLSNLLRCRSKKTSKFRVTGLCEGNSPVFPFHDAIMNCRAMWMYLLRCGLHGLTNIPVSY